MEIRELRATDCCRSGTVRRENETLQDAGFLKLNRTFMKRKQNDLNEKVLKFLNQ